MAALRSEKLAGAGLDVTDPEPLPAGHPLWRMPNVVITPHVAGGSDRIGERRGVAFMSEAGYDPRAMIGVQEILASSSGGAAPPEFFSTHPSTGNRIQTIEEAIGKVYPNGVPDGMIP